MIRTINSLIRAANKLIANKELLVESQDGDEMVIVHIERKSVESDPNDFRYILKCKKAGNGCIPYK